MAKSQNPSIVVTRDPKESKDFSILSHYGTVEATSPMEIRVKGAGFDPGEPVIITICRKNTPIGKAVANACGAFETMAKIPRGLRPGVISVKAMVGKETIRAAWPLNIVPLKPPK